MAFMRLLLFALAGAIGAAVASFAVQFVLLRNAGADPLGLEMRTLLLEVMTLHRHALLGSLVGVVLGPFPARADQWTWGTLRWGLVAMVVVVLWPLIDVVQSVGGLPTVSELVAGYGLDPALIPAAAGAAVACGLLELLLLWAGARRAVARRRYRMGGENQVDETLREFWQRRADTYLAAKSRHEGEGGG